MQSTDLSSLSSSGVTSPGYQRVRTQTEENLAEPHHRLVVADELNNDNNTGSNLVIVDHTTKDLERHISPSSTLVDESSTTSHANNNSNNSNNNSIFRQNSRSSAPGDLEKIAQTVVATVSSTATAATTKTTTDGYQQVKMVNTPSHHHAEKSSMLRDRSRNNSWDMEDANDLFNDEHDHHHHDDDHDDHDDDVLDHEEEDDHAVRRYVRNRIPIVPAEFSHRPFPHRVWQAFVELRTAARQRRAARLLASNHSHYDTATTHCVLTWCCDATDRGIALVAIVMLLWMIIGWTSHVFRGYWLLGMILFAIRVSARRTYESLVARKRRMSTLPMTGSGQGSMLPSPSSSSGGGGVSPGSSLEMKDYRDHA